MHDVSNDLVPSNLKDLFIPTVKVHSYNTPFSVFKNCYVQKSNSEIKRKSFSRIGAKLWNEIPTKLRALPKISFENNRSYQKLNYNLHSSSVLIVRSCFVSVSSILLCNVNYTEHLLKNWCNMCFSYAVFLSFVCNTFFFLDRDNQISLFFSFS